MKKLIIVVTIIFLASIGYIAYTEFHEQEEVPLEIETEHAIINEYYIYGTNLNIKGTLSIDNTLFDEIDLVLYNKNIKLEKKETIDKKFLNYKINYTEDGKTINFYLSEQINDGMYLDNINIGTYNLFIRTKTIVENDDQEEIKYKYYSLDNQTEYKETIYYTMSNYNHKITINTDDIYKTMTFNIKNNNNQEVYDIVLDAGHGGKDPGAVVNGYKETDFTLTMAKKLKDLLEEKNIKVKLTRDDDTLATNEWFEEYGKGGRAQISHEVHAKYLLSIHLNSNASTSINGVELYTAYNINYDFAKSIVKKIVENTNINYSNLKLYKIFDGIYTHTFSEYEITQSTEKAEKENKIPYDITTISPYLYMIRETGGIMTGAYVDDRNESQNANEYYKSNVGTESYLLETCYMSNKNDISIFPNEIDKYVEALADSISAQILK